MTDQPTAVATDHVAVATTGDDDVDAQQHDATSTDRDDNPDGLGDAGKQAIDRMKAEKAEAVKRSKALEREVAALRKQTMNDNERAIAEAEERGKASVMADFGKRLARTEFDALAGRRNPDFDTDSALEFVDLGRFIGEDGEPDRKAIRAAVDRLIPEPQNGPPSYDGGARTPAKPAQDMNSIIRRAAGARG